MTKGSLHFAALVAGLVAVLAGFVVVVVLAPQLTAVRSVCGCQPTHWTTATWAIEGGAAALLAWLSVAGLTTLVRTRRFLARSLAHSRTVQVARKPVTLLPGRSDVFSYGFLRPRIALGAHLLVRLTASQCAAVLAHEAAHVRRFDPLRLAIVESVATALGDWLGGRLERAFRLDLELDADEDAVARHGAGAVARAFLAVLEGPRQPEAVAVPFLSVTEGRALGLLGERPRRLPWAALLTGLLLVSGLSFGLRASIAAARSVPDLPPGLCRAAALCARPPTAWTVQPRPTCFLTPSATWCLTVPSAAPMSHL